MASTSGGARADHILRRRQHKIKTDRREGEPPARLPLAGELRLAYVPEPWQEGCATWCDPERGADCRGPPCALFGHERHGDLRRPTGRGREPIRLRAGNPHARGASNLLPPP
jgi:hypothetical protein